MGLLGGYNYMISMCFVHLRIALLPCAFLDTLERCYLGNMNAIESAEAAGVDLSLIDDSLSRSCEERAIQHQDALNLALEMERAGNELRERYQSASSAPLRR